MGLFRFATFTLDISGSVVKQGDRLLMLRRQPFKVLSYLVERPSRLVTNRELIESCWGENSRRTSVNSLAQCIKAIREALGETDQEIIRTVHGQGYVFTAQVTAEVTAEVTAQLTDEVTAQPSNDDVSTLPPHAADDVSAAPLATDERPAPKPGWLRAPRGPWRAPWRAWAATITVFAVLLAGGWELRGGIVRPGAPTMMAVPSIAVLPFEPGGGGLAASDVGALSDDVMTDLARVPRGYALRIESTSVDKVDGMPLRSVGRRLGVRCLVTGMVRREDGVRQINVQLIEAESGRAVWAELFDQPLGESGADTRVAEAIARAVGAQVLRAESRLPLPAHPEADISSFSAAP